MFAQNRSKLSFVFFLTLSSICPISYSMDQSGYPNAPIKTYLEGYITINNNTEHVIGYELSSKLTVISAFDALGSPVYNQVDINYNGIIRKHRYIRLPKKNNAIFTLDSNGENTVVKPIFGDRISMKISLLTRKNRNNGYKVTEQVFADDITPGVYDVKPIKRDLK